jgi:Ca-activated chloride channel family protein
MSFDEPLWLLSLLLPAALVVAARLAGARRRRYALRFPAAESAALAAAAGPTWRRRLPAGLLLAGMIALVLGLARPHVPHRVAVGEASLMLVSDHSGSMAATDVTPTRLAAAIHAADRFIGSLPTGVRVGAVAFGDSPDAAQGPSTGHSAARAVIDSQAASGATDTGDALDLALRLLRGTDPHHPPAAVVLLSDGAANTGEDVLTVARRASAEHIPIYTVSLGTPDGTVQTPNPLQPSVPVPPDPQLMRQIAQLAGGRTFDVQGSADELSSVYANLARQLATVSRPRDATVPVVLLASVLLAVALSLALLARTRF